MSKPRLNSQRAAIASALLVAFLLALVPIVGLAGRRHVTQSMVRLPALSLTGYHRLLVLAPHCDDETLGAGGLIRAALQAGMEVRVVIATNGDGFLFATMEDFHRIYPTHQDFIRMGRLRQEESLQALEELGLPPDRVMFLSYPDRGTPALWEGHWSASNPYRSPYSGDTRSPYERTYHPQAVYAGEDLLADLETILADYQPDLIVYPHPEDVHPDHWGVSAFTRLALAYVQRKNPGFRPNLLAYLVHRPDFPALKGYQPEASLLPPPPLLHLYPDWLCFDLDSETAARKRLAVEAYRSQRPLLHTLLDSFVRQDELFGQVYPADLVTLSGGSRVDPSTWHSPDGVPVGAVQGDPVQDILIRSALPPADLVAVYAARGPDEMLVLCSQVRGKAEKPLRYTLRVLAAGPAGVVHWAARNHPPRSGWQPLELNGPYACARASLKDLGDPWAVFVGAEVEEAGIGVLDQAAWQIVEVRPDGTTP